MPVLQQQTQADSVATLHARAPYLHWLISLAASLAVSVIYHCRVLHAYRVSDGIRQRQKMYGLHKRHASVCKWRPRWAQTVTDGIVYELLKGLLLLVHLNHIKHRCNCLLTVNYLHVPPHVLGYFVCFKYVSILWEIVSGHNSDKIYYRLT